MEDREEINMLEYLTEAADRIRKDTKAAEAPTKTDNGATETPKKEEPAESNAAQTTYLPNHRALINNQLFSDVSLVIGKKAFHAHSCVFIGRCPSLYHKTAQKGKKKSHISIDLPKETKESVLQTFLTYVYTDQVDLTKLSVNEILLLNQMAMEYELKRLQWICENHLNESFTNTNIHHMLVEAEKVGQARIKNLCFQYVVKNYNDVISNKDGVQVMGVLLFQEAVTAYQQHTSGKLEIINLGKCPPSTLVDDYKAIHKSIETGGSGPEVTPFKINKSPQFMNAHRPILAAQTTKLAALCTNSIVKEKSGEYVMVPQVQAKMAPEITAEAFDGLLKFVYYGDTNIDPVHACELVVFSFEYGMQDLNKLCYEIIGKNINTKTAIPILGITFLEIAPLADTPNPVKTIKRSALMYIHNNIKGIDLRPLKRMNPLIAVDIVLANQPEALDEEPEPAVSPTASGTLRKNEKPDKSKSKADLMATTPKKEEPKKEEPKKEKEDPKKVKKEFSSSAAEIGGQRTKEEPKKEEPKKEEPKKEEPKKEEPKKDEPPQAKPPKLPEVAADVSSPKSEKKKKKKEQKEDEDSKSATEETPVDTTKEESDDKKKKEKKDKKEKKENA